MGPLGVRVLHGGTHRLIQYDTSDGKVLAVLIESLPQNSRIASIGHDGNSLLVCEPLGHVVAVTVPPLPGIRQRPGILGEVVGLHADGNRVLIHSPDGLLRLISLGDGSEYWRSNMSSDERCGGFSIDGEAVVIASTDALRLLSSADGKALGVPMALNSSEDATSWPHGRTVSLSGDRQQVMVIWGNNRFINLFNTADGTEKAEFGANWSLVTENMGRMFYRQHAVGDLRVVSHLHEMDTHGLTFGWNEVFLADFAHIAGFILMKPDERLSGPFVHAMVGPDGLSVVETGNRIALIGLESTQSPLLLPEQASRLITVDADTGLILTTGATSLDVWEAPGGRLVARLPAQPEALDGQNPWSLSPWQRVAGPWRWHRDAERITLRRRHGTQIQEWPLLRALPSEQEPEPPVVAWVDAGRAWAPAAAGTTQPAWAALHQAEGLGGFTGCAASAPARGGRRRHHRHGWRAPGAPER